MANRDTRDFPQWGGSRLKITTRQDNIYKLVTYNLQRVATQLKGNTQLDSEDPGRCVTDGAVFY